ncbi:MAG: hypothetical protein JNM00_14910, partial [Flavobacteriales bacterium]|nr:hypothetical protein [Flavobacteriales bacterium]
MNRICYAALLICMGFNTSRAQYEVGHQSLSFYDEPRDRDVTIEVYYPADSPGDDVAFTTGSFPLVVFGHGFVMPWDDYQNIWNFLVPSGYCMAFLTTESGIVPDHENYGLDFVFIANSLMAENDNDASIFYQHLTDKQGF